MVADELINDMHVPKTKVLYNTINMSRYKHSAAEKKSARKKLGLRMMILWLWEMVKSSRENVLDIFNKKLPKK